MPFIGVQTAARKNGQHAARRDGYVCNHEAGMMDRKVMMDRRRQDSVSAVQEDEENGGKERKRYKLKRRADLSSCAARSQLV